MATSSKFDPTSSSPDRPLYTGQRGSHMAASLDRSGSFRESMESPMLSSLTSMSRSSSSATHGDVVNFFNCVNFDSKLLAGEHKSNRQIDYKRHVNVALGISPDESPSSSSKGKLVPEEIKRLKDTLYASHLKARERVKMFSDALSVFHKVFPSITSKKRSRAEGFSSDRSNAILSDRTVLGPSISKVGIQGHAATGTFELEQQKSEERTKNPVPNKRTRTSMLDVRMDVRTNSLVRPSGPVDREKEMLRITNSGAVQGEERALPIGGDGWEKSKMKKKRSCIKLDGSPNTLTKPVNTFQETKQGMQQRLVADGRSKLSNDSHSFRPGVSNGTVGSGKSDGISQQTGLAIRTSTPRNDQDNGSLVNERRGRPASSDKEKVNFKAVNKATVRDEFNSASPTSGTKMNSAIRAPRSSSGVAPKLSPVVHRAAVPNDWELSHCTTKPPAGVGTNNRKRVASARSSSPPVVHWQRPQKSSRTARRTNFMPSASNNDEAPSSDAVSDVAGNDAGLGFARRLVGNSQQNKLKGDTSSSAALSESEESGMAEVKPPKEKSRKSEEIEQKGGQNIQKVSNLVLPTRKNKIISGEEHGDGVRRQGRTGRGFTASRSLVPMTSEKLGNIGTAKQLRSARLEKNESKAGRPPTRKLSDRKAYARQKPTAVSAAADFIVGSEDGHEELLAAVKAVINSARAFSSPFWKQMEPFFSLISEDDIANWKQKENLESSTPMHTDETIGNGFGLNGFERDVGLDAQRSTGIIAEQLQPSKGDHSSTPLYQRLIAALISEDCDSGGEDFKFDAYDAEFETDGEFELSGLDYRSRTDFQFCFPSAYNGYRIFGNPEHNEGENDVVRIPSTGLNSSLANSVNGLLHDKESRCSELQYDSLDINDKLLLELQSIGIALEPVPEMSHTDDERIMEEIARVEELYQGQVSKKKGMLDGLLNSATVGKELLEKDFERRAMEKLIVMAYEKYMACWGPGTSGGRNSSNKMAKQAALGFVKRTLERCHQFEDTGKSCFSESSFKDMFVAAATQLNAVRQLDGMEAESSKPYVSPLTLEARTASMGSQQSPSQFSQNLDNHDLSSSDMFPAINHSSEQNGGKEDLWSNRLKKRELSLDDVGGTIGTSSAPGIVSSLTSSAKGKRSERDRDGKGHGREVLSRNGTTKVGRPASSSAKGERKSKAKPKQKATQHSVSVNGLVGKLSEQPKAAFPSSSKSNETSTNSNAKEKDEYGLGGLDEHEPIDLSNLQLPGIDDLADQGQDLGSWLNIDDDGLQDNDFMGLEIPMDDLSDLNMMV
ncbi:hypothetical protein HN51_002024 [Arachis hypogaea]|uniref:Uncharacterized protein n=1 Tax=Arachis hypogaea TaxID=3818 RepID=A0A445EP16_ARAHY|nr:uncharacterized protein LOC112696871 [Arachis hypogaea]XP_025605587.1 uncharacterized protein LOC112696871 [Arachis hypogaea]XP_025605594.1 uncharacterized protein LOC112696871 [Arachis hypogaea]QHO50170.1 uncharacterized protein DS421_1g20330 [Arachis hypogaea]RYR77215.1 hypothetical protein Ahy_A01g001673 [Arachis hypogaea]